MIDEALYSIEEAEVFATGIPHPEGVAFDNEGWLYTGCALPDYKGTGPIYRISPDGKTVKRFSDTGGRVLGLAFDQRGHLYVCDSKLGAVFLIKAKGEVELFADKVDGRELQMPNFLVFDSEGGLYVSDSGTAKAGEATGAVYYFLPNGAGRVFLDELVFPNGLALSEGDRELYVVQTRDNCLLRVPIEEDGVAGKPVVFADKLESGPDGVALDIRGNVYVTITRPSQIVRVSSEGDKKIILADPSNELLYLPSNIAFGGPQNRNLYIANLFGRHITRLEIDEAGLLLFSQR